MKRFLLVFSTLLTLFLAFADALTDKTMSKISRDTKTYISAECRAQTEQEAYEKALENLSMQISDYMKEHYGALSDAVYLSEVSSLYQRLSSHSEGSRYRVMLYVKKDNLKPMGNKDSALVLAKNDNDNYEAIPMVTHEPIIIRDTVTVVNVVEKPLHPIVSMIMACDTKDAFSTMLTQLRKENKISGAAVYPLSNDYYIAIVSATNKIETFIHVMDNEWTDIATGKIISPSKYNIGFSAYWFTLSN